MSNRPSKILLLTQPGPSGDAVAHTLSQAFEVRKVASIAQFQEALRQTAYDAALADHDACEGLMSGHGDVGAAMAFAAIGQGACIADEAGELVWSNLRMQQWPEDVSDAVRMACRHAYARFAQDLSASPMRVAISPNDRELDVLVAAIPGVDERVSRVAAVVLDAEPHRRLQRKLDAIDLAGRELVRLEADSLRNLDMGQRLRLLEDKIIRYTRELLHFDTFAIRLIDRRTNRLETVINAGMPTAAANIELHADQENNGISGFVAATGRSYICGDTETDPRYVQGLDRAKSSLTVPLYLYDRVIGVFNVESTERDSFHESDRQFAEIFARYVAVALNILDLLVRERVTTSHTVADVVASEVAGPLNDITLDAESVLDSYADDADLCLKIRQILENVGHIRDCTKAAADGPQTILGARQHKPDETKNDLAGTRVLVVDDSEGIRNTIADVLRKHRVRVVTCDCGTKGMDAIEAEPFDLVLSDIKMPDRSGYDIFLQARERQPDVPVILMTGFGYDPSHSIVRASQEGLQAVLFKPFRVEQLLGEVRRAVSIQKQQPTPA